MHVNSVFPVLRPADDHLVPFFEPAGFHHVYLFAPQDEDTVHPAFPGENPFPVSKMHVFRVIRRGVKPVRGDTVLLDDFNLNGGSRGQGEGGKVRGGIVWKRWIHHRLLC